MRTAVFVSVLTAAAAASAQAQSVPGLPGVPPTAVPNPTPVGPDNPRPTPTPPPPTAPTTAPTTEPTEPAGPVDAPVPTTTPPADPTVNVDPFSPGDTKPAATPYVPPKPEAPAKPHPPLAMPVLISTPTGFLLPAAVLYSRTGIDTAGGVSSDHRVGLGDVAEFGIATTDEVRERQMSTDAADRIQPYFVATFRLGVQENRLFAHQPGVALGFRKSFERTHDGEKTRFAELTLVASEHLGKHAAIHVGGAFWDASVRPANDSSDAAEVTLHGFNSLAHQIRAFGGLEARPLPRSEVMIDLGWAPEFCYQCTGSAQIKLRPELSWGVRYEVASWMHLESGVRVPDIGSANLLDAQIFGQVTLTTWALHQTIKEL